MRYLLRSSAKTPATNAGTGSSASGVDQSINGQGPSFTNNLVENTEHALEANESSKFGPASAFDSQVSNAEAEDSSATSKQGSSALVPGVEATQESSSHGPSTEAGSTTSVVQATSVAQSTEDVPPPAQTQRRIPGTCPTPDFGAMTPTDAGLSSAFHAPTPMKDLQLDSPVEQQFSQASPRAQEFGPSTASPTSSNTVQANLARATHALSRQTLTRPAYLSGANKANSNTSHQQAANRILDGGSISPRACDQCVKKNHECIINEQKSTKCCWCTSTAYPCNAAGTKQRPRPIDPADMLPGVNYLNRTKAKPREALATKVRKLEDGMRDLLTVENKSVREGLEAQNVKSEKIWVELRNFKHYAEHNFKRKREDDDDDDDDEDVGDEEGDEEDKDEGNPYKGPYEYARHMADREAFFGEPS